MALPASIDAALSEGLHVRGIILANTGSPSSPHPNDIERYLRDFLLDDRIRQLPKPLWKWLLHKKILPKRKYSSAQRYDFIWTEQGSPLVIIQQKLADKVQALLDEDDALRDKIMVRSAMSYGSPSIEEALKEMRGCNVDEVVLLPLYPQSAFSPTLAVTDAFWRAQASIGWHPKSTVIDNYHDDPGYIAAMTQRIRSAGFNPETGDKLLLSFHAIPLKDEKAGDTYRSQIVTSVELIAAGLNIPASCITVAFQSVFGPNAKSWTSPLAQDVMHRWRDGDFRVVFACPGFSIDCLETLYDVPHVIVPALEGEDALPVVERVGGDIQAACNTSGRFVWVPSLNASDEHAALIGDILLHHL